MPRVSPGPPFRLPSLIPQMLLCHLNGKWVRSGQGRGLPRCRLGDAGRLPGAQGSDSLIPACAPGAQGGRSPHCRGSLEQAGGQAGDSVGRAQGRCCRPSRCVTGACLCNSPCSTQWSPSREPRAEEAAPQPPRAVTAQELLGGRAEGGGTKAVVLAPPPCPPTMCQSEARRGPELSTAKW